MANNKITIVCQIACTDNSLITDLYGEVELTERAAIGDANKKTISEIDLDSKSDYYGAD